MFSALPHQRQGRQQEDCRAASSTTKPASLTEPEVAAEIALAVVRDDSLPTTAEIPCPLNWPRRQLQDGGPVCRVFRSTPKPAELKKLNEDKRRRSWPVLYVRRFVPKGDYARLPSPTTAAAAPGVFAVEADGKLGKRVGFDAAQGQAAKTPIGRRNRTRAAACSVPGYRPYSRPSISG